MGFPLSYLAGNNVGARGGFEGKPFEAGKIRMVLLVDEDFIAASDDKFARVGVIGCWFLQQDHFLVHRLQ